MRAAVFAMDVCSQWISTTKMKNFLAPENKKTGKKKKTLRKDLKLSGK